MLDFCIGESTEKMLLGWGLFQLWLWGFPLVEGQFAIGCTGLAQSLDRDVGAERFDRLTTMNLVDFVIVFLFFFP